MAAVIQQILVKKFAPDEGRKAYIPTTFFLMATVLIAPLTVIDIPLLADYQNHVARMHIIGNVDRNVLLTDRFDIDFDVIPNIAMDLVVPWLAEMMPLHVAARVFAALALLSSVLSVAWLHRILFNQWSTFSWLAVFFAYHGSMIAGMLNFSLGIGLTPAALALWIRLQNTRTATRVLLGSLIAIGLFFCHLVAFGGYGLLLIGFAIARMLEDRSWRRGLSELAIAGATGLLPLLLIARMLIEIDGGGASFGIVYGDVSWKLKALLSPLANYNRMLDVLTFALLSGLGLIGWLLGWLSIDRRMLPGLVLLATAFILAPKALWTGGVFDQRLAVLLALILVASMRFRASQTPAVHLLSAALALLFLTRIAVLTSAWIDHRDDLAEMRDAIDLTKPGGRILVVRPDLTTGPRLAPARHRVFHHAVQLTSLPTLAVIEKSAFVSTLYALPGQQPLVLKPPFDQLGGRGHVDLPTLDDLAVSYRQTVDDPPPRDPIRNWVLDFDYVLMIYGYGPGTAALADGLPLETLMDGEILDFFKIARE